MIERAPKLTTLLLSMAVVLAACGARFGATESDPITFLEAKTHFMGADMVEVEASVIYPTPGAVTAYADCVAARYASERGKGYISRVLTRPSARGDIELERTTYLLSNVRPDGKPILSARDVLSRCATSNVPTG